MIQMSNDFRVEDGFFLVCLQCDLVEVYLLAAVRTSNQKFELFCKMLRLLKCGEVSLGNEARPPRINRSDLVILFIR